MSDSLRDAIIALQSKLQLTESERARFVQKYDDLRASVLPMEQVVRAARLVIEKHSEQNRMGAIDALRKLETALTAHDAKGNA